MFQFQRILTVLLSSTIVLAACGQAIDMGSGSSASQTGVYDAKGGGGKGGKPGGSANPTPTPAPGKSACTLYDQVTLSSVTPEPLGANVIALGANGLPSAWVAYYRFALQDGTGRSTLGPAPGDYDGANSIDENKGNLHVRGLLPGTYKVTVATWGSTGTAECTVEGTSSLNLVVAPSLPDTDNPVLLGVHMASWLLGLPIYIADQAYDSTTYIQDFQWSIPGQTPMTRHYDFNFLRSWTDADGPRQIMAILTSWRTGATVTVTFTATDIAGHTTVVTLPNQVL